MMDLDDIMGRLPARAKIIGRANHLASQLKAEMLMRLLEDPEIAENFSIVECCVRVSDEGFAKLLQAIEQAPKEPNEALKRLMMDYKPNS